MNGFAFGGELARPWLAAVDPRLKLTAVFAMSVAVVCFDAPSVLAGLCAISVLVAAGLRLRSRGWLTIVVLLAMVVWSTMLSQGFFYPVEKPTVLLTIVPPRTDGASTFPGIRLTLEGLLYGAVQSLRLVATMLLGLAASLSTGPERMLVALSALRVPSAPAFMTATALRFLPLLVEELLLVRQARRLRGYRFRRWRPWREVGVLLPVIAGALRRAETLAESVTARGFDHRRPRTHYPPLTMRPWEAAAMCCLHATSAVLIVHGLWRAF